MTDNEQLISDYLNDALSEEQNSELQEWLKEDPNHLRSFITAVAREEQLRSAVVAATVAPASEPTLAASQPSHQPRRNLLKWTIAASLIATATWFGWPTSTSVSAVMLTQATGAVSLRDGSEDRPLNVGEKFTQGVVAVAGHTSHANFSLTDGSTLLLTGESELGVQREGKNFSLRHGALIADVKPQRPQDPLTVKTLTAEATVDGTAFAMNAAASETLLQVQKGRAILCRLADNETRTVDSNQQVVVGKQAGEPLKVESLSEMPLAWRATPKNTTWLGTWDADGVLQAETRTVFLKAQRVEEKHFHAGARNSYPGLVRLNNDSAIRIRYRLKNQINIGIFMVTHVPVWNHAGNFQAYVETERLVPDEDGWMTAIVPIKSFYPKTKNAVFKPDCVASAIYVTTWADDAGLEIKELAVISGPQEK